MRSVLHLLLTIAMATVAGCDADDRQPSTAPRPVTSESASASSTEPVGAATVATWDPSSSAFSMSASGPGTLQISAKCILLVLDNGKVIIPVWPIPSSMESGEVLTIVDVHGNETDVRSGDRIELSGRTGVPHFVTPPDPACEAEEMFIANGVEVLRY